MRVLLLALLLALAAGAQGPRLEFLCEPGDALVYQVGAQEVLLGRSNQPLAWDRADLPEQVTLLYRRPGWKEARVTVRREDLRGPRYPHAGRALCLTPGTSLRDRAHQFIYAARSCAFWIGFILIITALLNVGQRMMNRQSQAPRALGAQPRGA